MFISVGDAEDELFAACAGVDCANRGCCGDFSSLKLNSDADNKLIVFSNSSALEFSICNASALGSVETSFRRGDGGGLVPGLDGELPLPGDGNRRGVLNGDVGTTKESSSLRVDALADTGSPGIPGNGIGLGPGAPDSDCTITVGLIIP